MREQERERKLSVVLLFWIFMLVLVSVIIGFQIAETGGMKDSLFMRGVTFGLLVAIAIDSIGKEIRKREDE